MNTFLTDEELTAIANEIDPDNIKGSHISIDPKKFDTKLPEERREEFNEWKRTYAPNDSGIDYDLQGAFLEGMTPGEDGHFPDKYKKPNHPTFSNESKYATGVMAELAGHWTPSGEYIPSPYVHLVHNRVEGWKHNGPGLVYLVGKDGKRTPFKAPKGGVTGEWAAGEVRKHVNSNLAWVDEYVPGAELDQMTDGVKLYMAMRNYRNRYELGESRAPQFRDAMLKIKDWGLHGSDLTDLDVIQSVIQSSLANVEKDEDFRRGYRDMMTYIAPLLRRTPGMPVNLYEYVTDKTLRTRMENTQRVILEQDRADEAVRRKRVKSRVASDLVNTGDYVYAKDGDLLSRFLRRHGLTEAQLNELNADNPDYRPGVLPVASSGKYPLRVKRAKKESRETRQAAKAGDTEGPEVSDVPVEEPAPQATEPVPEGGPRIVINPEVFEDKRDALCVAMNEAFRVLMEVNGFNPVSEPTDAQRQFFADTAYSQNENQMRRTILARICTFDTSVKDPTNEQIDESVEFLEAVMEMGAPQNEWEQQAVQRIHDVLKAALETGAQTSEAPVEEAPVEEAPVEEAPVEEAPVEEASVGS
jgi:hypothetical protein